MNEMWTGNTKNVHRLIIAITGGLGDNLLITPFIRFFRKTGRYKQIDCAVPEKAVQLFDLNPHLDCVIPCKGMVSFLWAIPEDASHVFAPYVEVQAPTEYRFPVNLAFRHLLSVNQGSGTAVRQIADWHGIPIQDESLEVHFSAEDLRWARNYLDDRSSVPVVLLNISSPLPEKHYPFELWEKVVDFIREKCRVIQLLNSGPALARVDDILHIPSIRRSAALFQLSSCVLTIDSFPGHLAKAVGTPAVVVFGPTNPTVFGHTGNVNLRDSQCPPCADTLRLRQCRNRDCLQALRPSTIAAAVFERLNLSPNANR